MAFYIPILPVLAVLSVIAHTLLRRPMTHPGHGHIQDMCPSREHDSRICHTCKGKGHLSSNCPNNVPNGVCYRCRQYGHKGR